MKSGSSWNSYPDFVDFEQQNLVFSELAAWSTTEVTVTGGELEPLRVETARVTHDLFDSLGVQPALNEYLVPANGSVGLGLRFAEQWERALEVDPEFIFLSEWNEWMHGSF